jgi:hypothetical protein
MIMDNELSKEDFPDNSLQSVDSPDLIDIEDMTPQGLFHRFRLIITTPTEFFDRMPLEGTIKDAVIFMAAIALVAGLGQIVVTGKFMQGVNYFVGDFALSFVSAGFLLVLSRGFGGKGNFISTYRAFVYAAAPTVIIWIPLLGYVAALYSLFLLRLSLERVHELRSKSLIVVIGIYVVSMIGVTVTIFLMVMGAIVAAKNTSNMIGGP